ncbi:MAG: BatD family protein, partial [Melioribacteraceae bacterium]|nr:BatD family protein [Melioribacteraceae bacterium]
MKKTIKIFLLVILTSSYLFAQEFSASVDKSTLGQNERFQIYFTFQNGDLNKLSSFTPPTFKGINLISGPNESRNMQIINGQVSGSLTYSFIAVAPNIGKSEIGSASVIYNGSKLRTEPMSITVVKGVSTNKQVDSKLGISKEELNNNVFIRAIP